MAQPLRAHGGGAGDSRIIRAFGPTVSHVTIDGRLYRLMTWTEDQWARVPERSRPEGWWWHGDLIALMQPS